ncbi:MAG: hypothetical protein RL491_465 [Bacteroidota bacterium]
MVITAIPNAMATIETRVSVFSDFALSEPRLKTLDVMNPASPTFCSV